MTTIQTSTSLSVSIVVYRSPLEVLRETVNTLLAAAEHALRHGDLATASVSLIHNAQPNAALSALIADLVAQGARLGIQLSLLEGHGNVGYGCGHNLALLAAASDFHLILNPDVQLAEDSLSQGLRFMAMHQELVALSPGVYEEDGSKQFVCKRYPSVLDFVLRGFAPGFIKGWFSERLAHYEMQDLPEHAPSMDIPIISGCFMLFRTPALQAVKGFDERYFLYFEDFDLSLRVHCKGALAYLPSMKIVHLGGNSAKKGLRHIGMFARSGLRFYNTHGWRLL